MALTFNGTTSTLANSKTLGVVGSTYPLTIFGWARPVAALQNGWALLLQADAADTANASIHYLGALQDTAKVRAYSSTGSSVGPSSTNTMSAGTWYPFMVVFAANNSRKVYLGNGAVQTDATLVSVVMSTISRIFIGNGSFKGDLACLGIWASELTVGDFQSLGGSAAGGSGGGVVPSTVSPSTLIDYWSLLTQAATQVGSKAGIVLTATNTSQAGSHPITESAASDATFALTLDDAVWSGSAQPQSEATFGLAIDDMVWSGAASVSPLAGFALALDDAVWSGAADAGGPASGTFSTPPLKNRFGQLLANETGVTVNAYHPTTGALLAHLTGQTSDASGIVTVASTLLPPGTVCVYEVVLASNGRRLPAATSA